MLKLRPYQREAPDALYSYWEEGGGNGLIVLPTAAGKSLVIATLCRELLQAFPDFRIGIVTHVKELIAQNAQELLTAWPQAPLGIYSAGLGRRDLQARILFMGIQSVHRKTAVLGKFDLIIVDEAHLIPRDAGTMYGRFFGKLLEAVRDMRVVGLTATPYRLSEGRLDVGPNRLFDDIVYEKPVFELIEQGYLSPLIGQPTINEIDTSKLHVRDGEFIESELADAASSIVDAAVAEIVALGRDRQGWLISCVNVAHAEKVRDAVRKHGITCEMVVGTTPNRDQIIMAYKRKSIRCLVFVGVLTTGFNAPHVDLLAMLRPTLSTGLYEQIVGRAFRVVYASGYDLDTLEGRLDAIALGPKPNALILDYAGNIRRHGPIDAVRPKRAGGSGKKEDEEVIKVKKDDVRAKECPECKHLNGLEALSCKNCGHEWPIPDARHKAQAEAVAILSTEKAPPQWIAVDDVRYASHEKEGSPMSVAANFVCGLKSYRSWLCFGHMGRPRRVAIEFWTAAGGEMPAPTSAEEALDRRGEMARVVAIRLKLGGRYPEVVGYQFEPREAAEAAE
ncbi:DEAD/DEAH box helicase [Xanthobacter sp. DSM 24535]|uniref:DEAD/DEAH box helicase n=1 Tax=Roseixanthobacter psychrophilus TaxID=3119917 RepID=UPI00372AFD06